MSRVFVMSHVRPQDNFIVHGPHWSWGNGYETVEQTLKALRRVDFGFVLVRCQLCGNFSAGALKLDYVCQNRYCRQLLVEAFDLGRSDALHGRDPDTYNPFTKPVLVTEYEAGYQCGLEDLEVEHEG